ncbi:response regulator transcription factor [Nocardiopsis sp. NPDC006139]|uniref:response regulator transcription factor n=1 Tax=Nocardiopsis TaxID=2013 RepID=UPI0033A32222
MNAHEAKTVRIGLHLGGALLARRIRAVLAGRDWSVTELGAAPGPGELEGLDVLLLRSGAIAGLPGRREHPGPACVVLLEGESDPRFVEVARWGAHAIVDRDDLDGNITHAIEQALAGAVWISPTFAGRWMELMPPILRADLGAAEPLFGESLTRREQEVLDLLTQGLSNSQIADRLILSTGAIKFHVSNLLRKFGCDRRSQLIARHGAGAGRVRTAV